MIWQSNGNDKAAAHTGKFPADVIQQPVHQLVADKGPGGVGEGGGQARCPDGLHHGLYRQRGKTGGLSARDYGLVTGLIALVIGDGRVRDVDGHALRRDLAPPRRLPHADHSVRPVQAHALHHGLDRERENRGYFKPNQLRPGRGLHQFHGLPRRVDALPAEGVKAGKQYFHLFSSKYRELFF